MLVYMLKYFPLCIYSLEWVYVHINFSNIAAEK